MIARATTTPCALVTLLLVLGPLGSRAQQPAPQTAPPAEPPPKNLQVLPKERTRRQVIDNVMKNWTAALGVRCQHCHVGEEGKPFSEWDFASDANPEKQRPRDETDIPGQRWKPETASVDAHAAGSSSPSTGSLHRRHPSAMMRNSWSSVN